MNNIEITLTVREIEDLAKAAGIPVEKRIDSYLDDMEIEFTIVEKEGGVEIRDNETSPEIKRHAHAVFCTEYPEEGICPLGPEIDK